MYISYAIIDTNLYYWYWDLEPEPQGEELPKNRRITVKLMKINMNFDLDVEVVKTFKIEQKDSNEDVIGILMIKPFVKYSTTCK